jgi:hypothetical protein
MLPAALFWRKRKRKRNCTTRRDAGTGEHPN